jgi:hypothetical protein
MVLDSLVPSSSAAEGLPVRFSGGLGRWTQDSDGQDLAFGWTSDLAALSRRASAG